MELPSAKFYFVADVHLGLNPQEDAALQRRFVEFIESIPSDAEGLYLLGDIFDFWVEYHSVVPKGYVRVLSALQRKADDGLKIFFLRGNHDYWTNNYFERELGIEVIEKQPFEVELCGRRFMLAHGDGLAGGDAGYTIIKHLFRSRFCIALMKALPTRWIFSFAHRWSASNRRRHDRRPYSFRGADDPLYVFADKWCCGKKIDYAIFGHLHQSASIALPSGAAMHILPGWIDGRGGGLAFDGENMMQFNL